MRKLQRVLIMAGGTGGHVFPGLAVANHFKAQGIVVDWLGTEKGLEAKVVKEAGFSLHFIRIHGVRRTHFMNKLFAPWFLMLATLDAFKKIRQLKPDLVIGMGGFVSGPGGIAAFLLRKKLIIHEQNAKPGLTNFYLSKIATKVLEGFPYTFKSRTNVMTVGNPVRREIEDLDAPKDRFQKRAKPVRLLVFGGSLGAKAINELLPAALQKLPADIRPLVYHQAGELQYNPTKEAYATRGIEAQVVPFIHEMAKAYAWADMVLCRAGALTIAELCTAGIGAILIPYPYAVDDHQTENAKYMSNHQAAILVQQDTLTEDVLADMLQELCLSDERRIAMASAAYQLRTDSVAEKILNICREVFH